MTRHIEALARQYLDQGHDVRVLAPYDPPDAVATFMHRGARPQALERPEYLISLGRTVGFKANGAVSNLSITPGGVAVLAAELRGGGYDVAHVHEPVAPLVGWVASQPLGMPLVGTFHSYSTKRIPNTIATGFGARQVLNHLHVRIAVSQAAAWTGRRWFGGRYLVIPNGVDLDADALERALADHEQRGLDHPLRIVFVGQAVERKGLPLLLRAFEALREHIPTELTVIGPSEEELAPLLMDPRGVRALGKVDEAVKQAELRAGDVLAAPSLGGESFGMVLTEAFAAGTTVLASDIAGYRDVVRDGVDGLLVRPGDALALAETLRDLHHEPERRLQLARAAAHTVQRFAWEHVAADVMTAYEEAIATPQPAPGRQRLGVLSGLLPADLKPRVRAGRLESLEPPRTPQAARRGLFANLRRAGTAVLGLGVAALLYLGLQKIGIGSISNALINSSPSYVLFGLVTMCAAMVMRGFSWHAILKAALPGTRVKLADALRATMIGVLMSSTLPARLGEPARALVIARRAGRPRE
ncbi:MAG: glycosyltransferase, partial [Solirubrobacteraceae bacterium]